MKTVIKEKKTRDVKCPSFNTRVTCEGQLDKKHITKYLICRITGFFSVKKKKFRKNEIKKKKLSQCNYQKVTHINKRYLSTDHLYWIIQITGIILMSIGFLIILTFLDVKTSFTLIFIGSLLLFMTSKTCKLQHTNKAKLNSNLNNIKNIILFLPVIISLSFIIWTIILYFVISETDFWIFYIFVFLGTLTANELTENYISISFKKKLNIINLVFFIGAILIIAQKVLIF